MNHRTCGKSTAPTKHRGNALIEVKPLSTMIYSAWYLIPLVVTWPRFLALETFHTCKTGFTRRNLTGKEIWSDWDIPILIIDDTLQDKMWHIWRSDWIPTTWKILNVRGFGFKKINWENRRLVSFQGIKTGRKDIDWEKTQYYNKPTQRGDKIRNTPKEYIQISKTRNYNKVIW